MPTEEPDRAGDLMEKFSGTITKLTVIVGGVVALNTAITTFSNDRVARFSAFRQAVAAEESYWKALYDDYQSTFDAELAVDVPRREAKLFAISNLANHPVPSFEEYGVSAGLKQEARLRLAAMQGSLLDALRDRRASGKRVADAVNAAAFAVDEASVGTGTGATTGPAAPVTPPSRTAPAVSYQTKVLAAGRKEGWDIDVFWCQGSGEAELYATAYQAAAELARLSTAGQPIEPGVILGRVRLRSLPVRFQQDPGYAARDTVLVYDGGRGEKEAAEALRRRLRERPQLPPFALVPSTGRSQWYLSAFVCPPAAARATVSDADFEESAVSEAAAATAD